MNVTIVENNITVTESCEAVTATVNQDEIVVSVPEQVTAVTIGNTSVTVTVTEEVVQVTVGSGGGGGGGVTDHGALSGLGDNDHPQYQLASGLGSAAFVATSAFDAAGSASSAISTHVGDADPHMQYLKESDYVAGITDHGALTGLGDNDHPQYLLAADLPTVISGGNFSDVPVLTGSGGKVVKVRVDETGFEYVTGGGGGGVTDHAELTSLTYADSGHTGFAGTNDANTFHQDQFILPKIRSIDVELVANPTFATDLSDWADAGVDWQWVSGGGAQYTGASGESLSQTITLEAGERYLFSMTYTNWTVGVIIISMDSESGEIYIDPSGGDIQKSTMFEAVGTSTLISLVPDSEFDGVITSVSVRKVAISTGVLRFIDSQGVERASINSNGSADFTALNVESLAPGHFHLPYLPGYAPGGGDEMWYDTIGTTNLPRITISDTILGSSDVDIALIGANGDTLKFRNSRTITNSTDTGQPGEMCWDADYIYVCVDVDTWKRVSLDTW